MMSFWIGAGVLGVLAALLVLWTARRGADAVVDVEDADARELDELDRLRERGLIDADAHRLARAEAGRRLLASRPRDEERRSATWEGPVVLTGAGATVAAALAVYWLTGSPGMADQPRAARVENWAAQIDTLNPEQIAAVAESAAREAPGDAEAQGFLGRARMEAGDPIGAASAFRRALAEGPETAELWGRLGEALTLAGEGRIGADAEAAFARALALDPTAQPPRYFLGQAALDRGDRARAAELWAPLIAALPADDPRRAPLLDALSEAEAGATPA